MRKFKIEKYVTSTDDLYPTYKLFVHRPPWTWHLCYPKWSLVDTYTSETDAKLMIKSMSIKPHVADKTYYDEHGRKEWDDCW